MTGVRPASGVGNLMSRSPCGGGQMTPSDRAKRSLKFSGMLALPSISVERGGPEVCGGKDGEHPGEPGRVGSRPWPNAGALPISTRKVAARTAAETMPLRLLFILSQRIGRARVPERPFYVLAPGTTNTRPALNYLTKAENSSEGRHESGVLYGHHSAKENHFSR